MRNKTDVVLVNIVRQHLNPALIVKQLMQDVMGRVRAVRVLRSVRLVRMRRLVLRVVVHVQVVRSIVLRRQAVVLL